MTDKQCDDTIGCKEAGDKALTQFAVKIPCDESTGFDEVGNYLATEADTTIDIAYYLDED